MSEAVDVGKMREILNNLTRSVKDYAEAQRRVFAKVRDMALKVRTLTKAAIYYLGKDDEEQVSWALRDVEENWESLLKEGTKISRSDFERFKLQAGQERYECKIVFAVWPFVIEGRDISSFPIPEDPDFELLVYLAALQDVPGELSKTLQRYAKNKRVGREDLLAMRKRADIIIGLIEDALTHLFGINGVTISVNHFRGGDFYSRMRQVERAALLNADELLRLLRDLPVDEISEIPGIFFDVEHSDLE